MQRAGTYQQLRLTRRQLTHHIVGCNYCSCIQGQTSTRQQRHTRPLALVAASYISSGQDASHQDKSNAEGLAALKLKGVGLLLCVAAVRGFDNFVLSAKELCWEKIF